MVRSLERTAVPRIALERGLQRPLEGAQAEGALQTSGDRAVGLDGEQPRLGLQLVARQRLAQPLVRVVALEDLLVDEGDAVPVAGLQLQSLVHHRAADARLA